MLVLDVEESTDHTLEFIVSVECAHGIIGEAGDELYALLFNALNIILGCGIKDLLVEIAGGECSVNAMGVKIARGPFVIRCDENSFHLGVFADLSAYEVQGLRGGH